MMAHLAKIGALTDELITLLTSLKSESAKFSAHREYALRALRYNNHVRTNQFDVASELEGLEEKFHVNNEGALADALKERVDKVSNLQPKWSPEILQLLLELSDRPLINSKVEDIDFLKEPDPDAGPPLRWKDLAAEDPLLRDKKIWKNVDFGAESSDDEDFEDSLSENSEDTETTGKCSLEGNIGRQASDYVVEVANQERLLELRNSQFWLKDPKVGGVQLYTVKKSVTELQAIREALFMLSNYPTSLFDFPSEAPETVEASNRYALKHLSAESFCKQLRGLAGQGSAVKHLRSWAHRHQSIALLQVFQGAITKRLEFFDRQMSDMQSRYVEPVSDIVVSLLQVQVEISLHVRSLVKLSAITKKLDAEPYPHAFRYLEMLYDETAISQMAGDEETYKFMGSVFFECFQMYLRPIRAWMEEGEVTAGDKVFFVSQTTGELELASIWQSRFKLRQTQDGTLHAPAFLQAATSKIFTTGKSVVVLKQLNRFQPMPNWERQLEPRLDFENVCNDALLRLAPFAELFSEAFAAWIQSKHHHASTTLRRILFDSCGLHTSLEALAYIYFMADGTSAAAFTNPLFDKVDTLDTSWSDQFTLTELLQSSFDTIPAVSLDRFRTRVLPLSPKNRDIAQCRRTVKVLSIIELKYHLSWPIQIILTPVTLSGYQRIFTFLFQIRRSSHILSRRRLLSDILNITSSSDERALFYSLRTCLLWFTQTLYYYLTCLVIEPASLRMRQELKEAVDIDTMIEVHSSFINSTVEKALLGNRLGLIRKTILKILDLTIKLEDAEAANAAANREKSEQQQDMMDMSMASMGLHTPQKPRRVMNSSVRLSKTPRYKDESSDEDEKEVDVDLSIMSPDDAGDESSYVEQLRTMGADFNTLVRFVTSGLKGVARVDGGEEAKSWDVLGEMLETGLGSTTGFMGNTC